MKLTHISDNTHAPSGRILLIFAGWGMDTHPFSTLTRDDYDLWVAYDYASPEPTDETPLKSASEICVLAWSFGVIEAARFIISHPHLPITLKVAVNGTHHPVDDNRGIPESIFQGTLDGLSEQSLLKFYRRMCGSQAATAQFLATRPHRSINSLRDELLHIASLPHTDEQNVSWDTVFISRYDRIIPCDNQQRAWAMHLDVRLTDSNHLPDFSDIIASTVTHKPMVARRFIRAASSYEANASVQRIVAAHLSELWRNMQPPEEAQTVVEAGAGTGLLTNEYLKWASPTNLTLWDLAELQHTLPGHHEQCDAETSIRNLATNSIDAIASASVIQWFDSPISFIHQCMRVVRPGGIIAIATYGPDNMKELIPFAPSPAHYLSAETWRKALQDEHAEISISEDRHSIAFDTPSQLLRHLRLTGVNTSVSTRSLSAARSILSSSIREITYHPIYIVIRMK